LIAFDSILIALESGTARDFMLLFNRIDRTNRYGQRKEEFTFMDVRAEPSWLELESVRTLGEAERLTSLDRDTLLGQYRHLCVRVSPKRWGMKLRNILKIADGSALSKS
jgi:hypothetical protein